MEILKNKYNNKAQLAQWANLLDQKKVGAIFMIGADESGKIEIVTNAPDLKFLLPVLEKAITMISADKKSILTRKEN